MRIGILTFHFNYNYGAVLQAYATASLLRSWGHDVSVPNFTPDYHLILNSPLRGWGLGRPGFTRRAFGRCVKGVRSLRARTALAERRRAFDRFRERHLGLSAELSSIREVENLVASYDACIVGSDQVWNLNLMGRYDGYFFLGFTEACSRRISYAACFGQAAQPRTLLERATPDIKRFVSVSVRNEFSRNIYERVTGRPAEVVVDPTLLYGFNEFRGKPASNEGKYILVYTLNKDANGVVRDEVKRLKAEFGARAVCLDTDNVIRVDGVDEYISSAGPEEWVSAISSAAILVTDSFHGCVFAAKFGIPFSACVRGWRSERLQEFIGRYGLQSATSGDGMRGQVFHCRTSEEAHATMQKDVQSSLSFLQRALST